MKVVFDTNVLVSSTLWQGSVTQKLLFKLIRSNVVIYSSNKIISEYQMVLKRDFGYKDDEVAHITKKIMPFIKPVNPKKRINIIKEDPDDNKIIECAFKSSAKYVITYDKHLLKICEYKGIKIIKPEEAIKLI